MRPVLLIIFLGFIAEIKAQDTLYVLFQESEINHVVKSSNITPDSLAFPRDWSRTYVIPKQDGAYQKKLRFSYWNDSFKASGYSLNFKEAPRSILSLKDFKSSDWFSETHYDDIIKLFENPGGKKPIVMLADQSYVEGDSVILIQVFFSFPGVE